MKSCATVIAPRSSCAVVLPDFVVTQWRALSNSASPVASLARDTPFPAFVQLFQCCESVRCRKSYRDSSCPQLIYYVSFCFIFVGLLLSYCAPYVRTTVHTTAIFPGAVNCCIARTKSISISRRIQRCAVEKGRFPIRSIYFNMLVFQ